MVFVVEQRDGCAKFYTQSERLKVARRGHPCSLRECLVWGELTKLAERSD